MIANAAPAVNPAPNTSNRNPTGFID